MSNQKLIIAERSRDIGSFLVGRLLPFRKKRMVGPFIFIDHMGPSFVSPGNYMDIGQHPHIGLSTLTYLFEGSVLHKDSIGSVQEITPGAVNWMTAGKGVVHTERTPKALRDGKKHPVHGFQIWVALPKNLEEMEPEFFHYGAHELPKWHDHHISFTLVAGEAFGKVSPVPVYSELFMLELTCTRDTYFSANNNLKGEIGICVVKGAIEACNERIEQGNMLVSKTNNQCDIHLTANTHLLIFGGMPFPEERHIFWNFVSTDKEKIERAKLRWKNYDFPMVPGESDYIALPE
ncbi:pirin family protein [Ascidiimonas aurantiaca]|uniref:pirin family protein n=1 Tax=Ascidiimonas aurantiaca TaxID=1685432 RepID=UPI0030EEF65B